MSLASLFNVKCTSVKCNILYGLVRRMVVLETKKHWRSNQGLKVCMSTWMYRQNRNEAISGMIWQRASKDTHSSLQAVELATVLAISHFNEVAKALVLMLTKDCPRNTLFTVNARCNLDQRRVMQSQRKSIERGKQRRKQPRIYKKGFTEMLRSTKKGPRMVMTLFN